MRILIVTQSFFPENFKANDIAFELAECGHKVDVLTGIPNYPEGKYFAGYGLVTRRIENVRGVSIYRAAVVPRGTHNKIKLILNYLTFWFNGIVWALFLARFKRYDCVFVQETSPIIQAYPAVVVKLIQRIPMYMWVLDIWPDSMISGGGIHNKHIIARMNDVVTNIYNHCDRILISSRGFEPLINRSGNYSDRMVYFPNWCSDMLQMPLKEIPSLPEGFVIMMAGNMGEAHNLDAVMHLAEQLQDTDVKWVFVGDGSRREWVEQYAEAHGLKHCVFCVGRHPFDTMPAFFKKADAMLITLKADFPHLRAVVPARLQSYMSAGRPVLGMIDGGAAEIISESGCGYCVGASDYKGLAEVIRNKVLPDKAQFETMGEAGRQYYQAYFTVDKAIEELSNILEHNE